MFRNSNQLARVCLALLAHANLSHLWTGEGPTPLAYEVLEGDGPPISKQERALFLVAWALWSGHEELRFATLLRAVGGELLMLVAGLLEAMALGPEAVDAWLEEHEPQPVALA